MRLGACRDDERRRQGQRVVFDQQEHFRRVGQTAGNTDRHHRTVFCNVGRGDGDLIAGRRAATQRIDGIGQVFGIKTCAASGHGLLSRHDTQRQKQGHGTSAFEHVSTVLCHVISPIKTTV